MMDAEKVGLGGVVVLIGLYFLSAGILGILITVVGGTLLLLGIDSGPVVKKVGSNSMRYKQYQLRYISK